MNKPIEPTMSWDEALRRIGAGEDIEAVLDEKHLGDHTEFVAWLREEAGDEAAERYLSKVRDMDSGIYGARMCWHSISPAQRKVIEIMATGRVLVRSRASETRYDASGEPETVSRVCGVATVRALAAHSLVAWDGGAFDPERKAVLTERGHFIWKHGKEAA